MDHLSLIENLQPDTTYYFKISSITDYYWWMDIEPGICCCYKSTSTDIMQFTTLPAIPSDQITVGGSGAVIEFGGILSHTPVELTISLNTMGITPIRRWLAFTTIINGVAGDIFLLSDSTIIPFWGVTDLNAFTFSFPGAINNLFSFPVCTMAALGLGAGDSLIYALFFDDADANIRAGNVVTLSIQ